MKYNMMFVNKRYSEKKYHMIYILFSDDDDHLEKEIFISEDTARFIIQNIDSVTKEDDCVTNNEASDPVRINWDPNENVVIVEFINDSTTVKFTKETMLQFQNDIMKLLSGYTTKIVRIE